MTVVTTSGDVSTTVITSVTVNSNGDVSSTAKQVAFTKSGTGDNHQFAMIPEKITSIKKIEPDLLMAAMKVASYKLKPGGSSQLQKRADKINIAIAGGASAAAAIASSGSSLTIQVLASVGAGVATGTKLELSPGQLSIVHKYKVEKLK